MKSYLQLFTSILNEMELDIASFNQIGNDLIEITLSYKNRDESVDLETCAQAAERLAEAIDYEIGLDISSSGAERVIENQNYESALNKYIYIKFVNPKAGMDHVEGELIEVNDDFVSVKYRFKHTHKTVDVERNNIQLLRLAVKI